MMAWFFSSLLLTALLWGCGNTVFAPSLREQPSTSIHLPWMDRTADAENEPVGQPINPGYPSPIVADGIIVPHNGQWTELGGEMLTIVAIGEDEQSRVVYLGRDCTYGAAPETLTMDQCESTVILWRTRSLSPVAAATELYRESVEAIQTVAPHERVGPLVIPRNAPNSASVFWTNDERIGQLYVLLTDYSDEASGIVAFGEWPAALTPLRLSEFTTLVARIEIDR